MPPVTFGEPLDDRPYPVRKGCYAVIFDDSRTSFAAVCTANGHYFLPGGGIEPGEEPDACLRREVLEETGYRIEAVSFLGEARRYFLTRLQEPLLSEGLFYRAVLGKRVQAPMEDDHTLVWLRTDEAERRLFHAHHAWAVHQV